MPSSEGEKMPAVKTGESRNQYLKRAIPQIMSEGASQKAAIGKAEGMYSSHWTGPKKKGFKKAL